MDNKSWQEEYAKLTRPIYEEWYFWPLLLLFLLALIFCGKAYQIFAADTAATERESNVAYHSTAESSVDTSEISSSGETSSESHLEESHSEESSESVESSTPEESSIEEVSEVIPSPPKPPQKIPAPENSVSESSSEIIDIPEDSSEESSSESDVSESSEEIPEESSSEEVYDQHCVCGAPGFACGNKYVVNTNTKKFHRPGCQHVKEIYDENRSACGNRTALLGQEYSPCKRCDP